jgi:hypothetical protein
VRDDRSDKTLNLCFLVVVLSDKFSKFMILGRGVTFYIVYFLSSHIATTSILSMLKGDVTWISEPAQALFELPFFVI